MGTTGSYRSGRAGHGVRLTRRGRVVVIVVVLGLLLGAFWLGTRQVSTASTDGPGAAQRTATVPPGGTLWDVAVRADPDTDPRITVERIMDLNDLPGPVVQPGERLRLPPPG